MNFDKIIQDFIKGAERAGGSVQRQVPGREEKLASNHAGIGAILGHGMGSPGLGGSIGAALGAEDGRGWQAAGGNLLGGVAGGGLGSLAGALFGPNTAKLLGSAGSMAGSYMGAQHFGAAPKAPEQPPQGQISEDPAAWEGQMAAAYQAGADTAKQAFLGTLASVAAPTAARGILGAVAPRAAARLAGPVAGGLFDTGAQMAANKAFGD